MNKSDDDFNPLKFGEILYDSFKHADKYHMGVEFLEYVLRELRRDESREDYKQRLSDACEFASREWDL